MPTIQFLLSGAVIGLSVAAPIGPVALLSVSRTLQQGMHAGIATGAGASTAHGLYGLLVLAGLGEVGPVLAAHRTWLGLLAALGMVAFAVRVLRQRQRPQEAAPARASIAGYYASALVLSACNPMGIALLAGATASVLGPAAVDQCDIGAVLTGLVFGSFGWWVCLNTAVALLRGRLSLRRLQLVNHAAAAAMLGFAVFSGLRAVTAEPL